MDPALGDRFFLQSAEIFACPACGGDLAAPAADAILCGACGRRYAVESGIPQLFVSHEDFGREAVTTRIRSFYERTPFPDYDDLDSTASLCDKARRSLFARLLDEQTPHDALVLEAGCGTGQLSNFLALTWGRRVFGVDLSLASLRLAQDFKERHGVERAAFHQMNLFRPAFKPGVFDLVVSLGVLHHTGDPQRGLATLAGLVRSGGRVVVGLYNTIARATTDARRLVFRATGGRLRGLDPYLRRGDIGARKKEAWFRDQYQNPHESTHTMGEVLRWLDAAGLEYVNGIPKPDLRATRPETEALFEQHSPGGRVTRAIAQARMLLGGGKEGGFFVVIARKP